VASLTWLLATMMTFRIWGSQVRRDRQNCVGGTVAETGGDEMLIFSGNFLHEIRQRRA
jgi:hypothetical protein